MSKEKKKSEKSVSFINWFITLIFSWIPGVNIIFFIFTIAFAGTRTKRNYAIAGLVLSLILALAVSILLFWFSDNVVAWLKDILPEAAAAPEAAVQ
ncbi:MAG: hypothetical protein IKI24_03690 [Clostridia bacterium]|jgi:hypothetical protein|nr:hypothetical protein [Clostridia bacterium]MCR4577449.1 hypothetical protein [Clostridiales bacterium]